MGHIVNVADVAHKAADKYDLTAGILPGNGLCQGNAALLRHLNVQDQNVGAAGLSVQLPGSQSRADRKDFRGQRLFRQFPEVLQHNRIVITNNDLKRFCSFHCFSLASMLHVLRNASGTPALPKHPSAPQCSTNPRRKQTESF